MRTTKGAAASTAAAIHPTGTLPPPKSRRTADAASPPDAAPPAATETAVGLPEARAAGPAGCFTAAASVRPMLRTLGKLLGRADSETLFDEQCEACGDAHPPLPDELVPYDPPYEWCDTVKAHKRNGDHRAALDVLDKCIQVGELVDAPAPWFYEQAAIVHRKNGDSEAEIAVLRRFAAQPHGAGASPPKLLARLAKLEQG